MNTRDDTFRKFLVVWFGQFISAIGSGLTAFALGVYVFQRTQSAMDFSSIILFSFLPSFILLPFGGVLADKFDRKRMMVLGDLGAIAGIMFILSIMLWGNIKVWHIYVGVALSSVFAAVQNPAYKAAVSDMVSEEFYSRASGLIQLAASAQYLISPIIAGILMNAFDIRPVLIIDIMTFVFAAAAVLVIKKQDDAFQNKHEEQEFLLDLAESFQYLFSQKGILLLVLLTSMVCFYVGVLQSLFGPMMLTMTNSTVLGTALPIMASGMLFSSLFIGIHGTGKKMVVTLSMFLGLAGLFYALMGLFTTVALMATSGFLFFITLPFVNTSLEVLIRTNVDNEKQGRTWSLVAAISQIGYILAFGSAGFLADHFFSPLLMPNGALALNVGIIVGTGPGRGIGFMFILSGLIVAILGCIIGRVRIIAELDVKRVIENREDQPQPANNLSGITQTV